MSAFAKVLRPLQKAVVAFFRHDLTLRRSRHGLEVVLQARAAPGKPGQGVREQARLQQERSELQVMLRELDDLLERQPGSRQTLRHIDFVRQSLHKKGLRALHKVPLDVLQRALEQFESLVSNWSPTGLASLRSKMAVAIIDREHVNDHGPEAPSTTAVMDNLPVIPALPEVQVHSDDEALAAAYAALAATALPAGPVELQADLGTRAAKVVASQGERRAVAPEDLQLRVLEN